MSALSAARSLAASGKVRASLSLLNEAQALAASAEEDPAMVGLLYFPDEHKLAVLLPLWAPLALPMLVGLVREIKRLREKKEKRAKKKKSD